MYFVDSECQLVHGRTWPHRHGLYAHCKIRSVYKNGARGREVSARHRTPHSIIFNSQDRGSPALSLSVNCVGAWTAVEFSSISLAFSHFHQFPLPRPHHKRGVSLRETSSVESWNTSQKAILTFVKGIVCEDVDWADGDHYRVSLK
jgi:hypothetical protein